MRIIGLISGTSLDGIDAALVTIPDSSAAALAGNVTITASATYPYPDGLRERLLAVSTPGRGSVEQICHLNAYVGELFAQAAGWIADKAGLSLDQVDAIGSHGQTIQHLPNPIREGGLAVTSTLQIGEPSIIAERTGVTTVADFRPRDMAAGGQGAPFAPFAHYWLFRHPERDRIITNIGGISNITYLPASGEEHDVIAFDTGPGNMILDALMAHFSHGAQTYDEDGRIAQRGTCCDSVLTWLLAHPYCERTPPKSTGREEFGEKFVHQCLAHADALGLDAADTLATVTAFTARTIADSCRRWLPAANQSAEREMFCGGGGVKNRTLMTELRRALAGMPVQCVDALGVPADALEAVTFALLARAALLGMPLHFPNVTGAVRAAVLGKILPGRHSYR